MKITYLKLKNFATIYTAMGKKEIEIDFSKCKNKVVLFVGPNGSGKTSILSSLHPFAYPGSMDIRNSSNLLREGEDGYKEIHIENDVDLYVISHFYKNSKRGVAVKSFIKKNGDELNPNGNVSSFIETVKIELSLELDFLRLLRLGSNVSNLIDMKASERKNFTSDLLSDINVYNDLSKKIIEDSRVLRNLLKTVSDKIEKLNVVDKDLVAKETTELERKLDEFGNEKDNIQRKIGGLDAKLSELMPGGYDDLYSINMKLQTERNNIERDISKINKEISDMCIISTSDIDTEIESLVNEKNDIDNNIIVDQNMALFYKKQLGELYDTKDALSNKIKSYVDEVEYTQLLRIRSELNEKISAAEERFKDNIPTYSKSELILILDILKNIDLFISKIREYDNSAILKTVEVIKEGKQSISSYVKEETQKIDREILKITSRFKSDVLHKNTIVAFRPTECKIDDCPYLYIHELLNGNESEETEGLTSLEKRKNVLSDMLDINQNIDYIFMTLKTNESIISKGGLPYFKINHILDSISGADSLYNEEYITAMISDAEDYEEYMNNKSLLKDTNVSIELAKSSSNNMEEVKSNLQDCDIKIADMIKSISELNNNVEMKQKKSETKQSMIDSLKDLKDKTTSLRDSEKSLDDVNIQIEDIAGKIKTINDINSEKKSLTQHLDTILWNIKNINAELLNNQMKLKEFETLTSERKTLKDKYDDIEIIRESLSSTKGIPLLFIQLYLKNTKIFVNELLSSVYSGDFEIDDFDINANEFNIPYIKNNIRVNDVSFASQGEQSFLSLALSFALISQSIKDYNILLLDEIDSTLDTKNRAMFLNILEKQMDIINAEQVFLITHNNAFDNYPVDIVLTGHNKLENYQNANVIYSN